MLRRAGGPMIPDLEDMVPGSCRR
eukprot:COSAG04_NODE_19481_length_415_cov_1.123418_1_plen_23_part_01